MKISRPTLRVTAVICFIASLALSFMVWGIGYGLGLEKLSHGLLPEKEIQWQISEWFFFFAKAFAGHFLGDFWTIVLIALQVVFYALVFYTPFYMIYRKQTA